MKQQKAQNYQGGLIYNEKYYKAVQETQIQQIRSTGLSACHTDLKTRVTLTTQRANKMLQMRKEKTTKCKDTYTFFKTTGGKMSLSNLDQGMVY